MQLELALGQEQVAQVLELAQVQVELVLVLPHKVLEDGSQDLVSFSVFSILL